jgi:glycosyltransferase 2 family protein
VIRVAALLGLAGVAGGTALVVWEGADAVFAMLRAAGWGLVWVSLFHAAPMVLNARAWRVLMPGAKPPSLGFFTWAVWVREAVNGLLPVARIGGEVASARLLMQHGVRIAPTVGGLVVDMTLTIVSTFLFAMLGLALLAWRTRDAPTVASIALGLLATLPILAALLAVQRFGFFELLARIFRLMFGGRFEGIARSAVPLDRAVRVVYRRRGRALRCLLWQLVGCVAAGGEIWLALDVLGHKVSILDAVLIEALVQAVSSAAFLVPGALGVQEGWFVVLGGLLGLAPELALALALARRARDLIVFVPALILWQALEGRRWLALSPRRAEQRR